MPLTLPEVIRRVQALHSEKRKGGCAVTGQSCAGKFGDCACVISAKQSLTASRKRSAISSDARFLKGLKK